MFETALNVEEFAGVVTAKAREECALRSARNAGPERPGVSPSQRDAGNRERPVPLVLSSPLRSLTLTVECLACAPLLRRFSHTPSLTYVRISVSLMPSHRRSSCSCIGEYLFVCCSSVTLRHALVSIG